MDRIEDLVANLSAAEAKNILKLVEELDRRDREGGALTSFVANPKQKEIFRAKKRVRTIMGGNRCLGGEQEVYDPVYGGPRRVDSIGGPFHVFAWDGKAKVIAEASAPFRKPKADLYRLTMDDGTTIVASPHHLFWGLRGWQECHLYVSQSESVLPHPVTNWGSVPSAHPQDADHYSYRVPGSQSDCPSHLSSYGEPLQTGPASGQGVQPSLADVQGHSKAYEMSRIVLPSDVLGDERECSHACPPPCRQPNQDALHPPVGLSAGIGPQDVYMLWKQVWDSPQEVPQLPSASSLRLQSTAVADLPAKHNHDHSSTPCCASNRSVVQIEYLRNDDVWDFEVYEHHNYFIGSVLSHNSGKSHCAAFEVACHATGIYPDWWEGYRYTEAIDMGVISPDTGQMLKTSQRKLMGPPDSFGTGFIPKELILELHERPQTNGCLDFALVKHASGGTTRMYFMTTQQTLKSFMGFMWRLAWFDEEPPWEYFDETRFRMLDKGGNILLSFYPPEGQTELISFLEEMEKKNPEYYESWFLEWADNPTLDPETVEMMEKTTPDWLKESRKYGRTGAGEGRCFPYSRDIYVCDPFEIERHWRQIAGFDVGFGHYTGSVCIAFDDMSNTAYVYKEYFSKEQLPSVHASALRRWGDVEFCIDTSSRRRSPTDGKNLFQMYTDEGLHLRDAETRGGSVESSIALINTMLSERRLFVFSTCPNLIKQMGGYRRVQDKQGKWSVLAKDNDLIDPLRYAIMWLNEARTPGVARMGPPVPRVVEWAPVDARIGI